MEHIQRTSQKYITLINLLLFCIPVAVVLYWILFNALPYGLQGDLPVQPKGDLAVPVRLYALLVTLLPASVGIYGLVVLKRLLGLYARGSMFTQRHVSCFYRLGYTLIAWVAAAALFTPLISAIVTSANSVGERLIVMNLGIGDLSTLIIGGVVLIIASVMKQGCEMEAEQAYTI